MVSDNPILRLVVMNWIENGETGHRFIHSVSSVQLPLAGEDFRLIENTL